MGDSIHPSVEQVLRHFEYNHLPPELKTYSRPFYELAHSLSERLSGPEFTVVLRKMLEAKDCMVRAALDASDKE